MFPKCKRERPDHFRRMSSGNTFVVFRGFRQARAGAGNLSAVHPSTLANGNEMSVVIHKSLKCDKLHFVLM